MSLQRRLLVVTLLVNFLITPNPAAFHIEAANKTDSASVAVSGMSTGVAGVAAETADPAESADTSWWATAQNSIRQSEYQFVQQDQSASSDVLGVYQAPNRANNLRTYSTPEGIRVTPRTATLGLPALEAGQGADWSLTLRLVAYGSADDLRPIGAATKMQANGNRFEYSYQSPGISEWYVNDEQGIVQGFIIQSSPPSRTPDSLILSLALTGSPTFSATPDGRAIDLITADGIPILRYGDPVARDSIGANLAADLALSESLTQVSVRVVSGNAVYPVTVTLTLTGFPAADPWTADGNQANADFGISVATAGDVNGDGFADVIVGAPLYDTGAMDAGRVFLYSGSPLRLPSAPAWIMDGGRADAHFGAAVSTAGDVNGDGFADVIVGAPQFVDGQSTEGRVYVYHGSAAGLSRTPNWTALCDRDRA